MSLVFHIVPGACSPASWYEGIRKHLGSLGHEAFTTGLLSAERRDPQPPATMQDDAAHVRSETLARVNQGKSIVLVMHSYGGVVGTESCKGLLKKDREAAGEPGGIVRLVYLTAAIVPIGGSVVKIFGGGLPDFMKSDGAYISHDPPEESANITFSELPADEALKYAKTLSPQSEVSLSGELSYPAYKHVPVSYMLCTEDTLVTPDLQRSMIKMAEEESGNKVGVLELPAGHCPFASMPEATAELLVKTALQ